MQPLCMCPDWGQKISSLSELQREGKNLKYIRNLSAVHEIPAGISPPPYVAWKDCEIYTNSAFPMGSRYTETTPLRIH